MTSDARPDVLEEKPIEDRPHPGLADVFFELRLEGMPFEDQLGDGTGFDAIVERNRLVVVARLPRPADPDFIEAAIVILGPQPLDVVLPFVEVETVADLQLQQRHQLFGGPARLA